MDQWGKRTVIAAVPLTAALGFYLMPFPLPGFYLFGFRLLICILLFYLLWRKERIVLNGSRETGLFFRVGMAWLVWGTLSVVWSSFLWNFQVRAGLVEIASVGAGFLYGMVLLNLVVGVPRGIDALRVGWVLAFIATGMVALWEIASGNHLTGYATDNLSIETAVYSTFVNPNNYAAFLALCFPFLLWSFRLARGVKRAAFVLLLVVLPALMVMTLGRLSLLALAIEYCLFLMLNLKWSSWRGVAIPVFSVILMTSVAEYDSILAKVLNVPLEFDSGGSGEIRLNLLRNGLKFLAASYGAGVGPANYQSATNVVAFKSLPTEGIASPHNFWIEISSQYGLIIFGAFLWWLGRLAVCAWRSRREALLKQDLHARLAAETVLVALAGYGFAACENSSYIAQQINWIFLASLLVICTGLSGRSGSRSNRSEPGGIL